MKIATAGIQNWYGHVGLWASEAWKLLGHDVTKFDRKEIHKLDEDKYDLIFFMDCSEDYSASIAPKSEQSPVRVFWAMDVQMPGGMQRTLNIAKQVDYVFCTNHEHGVMLLEKFGVESTWVPYGYSDGMAEEVKYRAKEYEDLDVMMVGNPNSPERVKLWEMLKANYKAATGRIENKEEYLKTKASCKICVSQPTEPYNNIINLRVFNALSCGKLLLCKRPMIKEHALLGLHDGVNVVYWDDFDDLDAKLGYYLFNDKGAEEGDKIAEAGSKLGNKYIMSNQISKIEQVIFSKFYGRLVSD
jgi:hypothetical protein